MAALEIRKADGKGIGVYADQDITPGAEVLEYDGRVVPFKEVPLPLRHEDDYFLQIGKDAYLTKPGGVGHYVNHSCDPNCGVLITPFRVTLVAIKAIARGEEITFDYSTTSTEDRGTWNMNCRCGTSRCRGTISGFHTVPENVRDAYLEAWVVPAYVLDHFIPYWLGYN